MMLKLSTAFDKHFCTFCTGFVFVQVIEYEYMRTKNGPISAAEREKKHSSVKCEAYAYAQT